jgi:hypothetical protein
MSNLNISIDLTKLPGAKVMDIEGKKSTRQCVVIPIDNKVGTVCDGYIGKGPEGLPVERFFDDVKLNLVAVEYKQAKHGISHGLKPAFSKETQERMTEEQLYNTPWLGTVKPWVVQAEEKTDDIGDLPEDDDKNW